MQRWDRLFAFIATTVWLLTLAMPVVAQGEGHVVLLPPELGQFPQIGFYIEAFDAQNQRLVDLQPAQVKVIEDGAERPLTQFERVEPGLQFIVAINAAPLMATRLTGGTIYEEIQKSLVAWAQVQIPGDLNDFSLVTNSGQRIVDSTNPQEWVTAVQSYKPDFLKAEPGLTSLNLAVGLLSNPPPRPLMRRVILYITPLPDSASLAALPNVASQATALGAVVFVWLVAPPGMENSPAAGALAQMASATGGAFFDYGSTKLPEPEAFLYPLRYLYHGRYASGVTKGSEHRLVVKIDREDLQLSSSELVFPLEILPPNPIFRSPPAQITRSRVQSTDQNSQQELVPPSQLIQILIEFPDHHERQLKRSRLFVDGVQVAENTRAPFDQFEWNLVSLTTSGEHILKVELEDELGLSGSTIDTKVNVEVEPQPQLGWREMITKQSLVIVGSLLAAAVVLGMVLVLAGRRRGRDGSPRRKRKDLIDPVSQPVSVRRERPARQKPASTLAQTQPRAVNNTTTPARLVRLSESGHPMQSGAIAISRHEVTFGSDPQQSICVLDSPSVSGLHARLNQLPDGKFILSDAGSIAGTWVNYAPVSSQGVRLEHGDLVHIGRVAFRFELSAPRQTRQATVVPYKEDTL